MNENGSSGDVFSWAFNKGGEVEVGRNDMNPERSPNPVIMVDVSDLETFYTNWDKNDHFNRLTLNWKENINRLIAFLILHGTSHLAGFKHSVGGVEIIGYWSKATLIGKYVKKYDWIFEDMIIDTVEDKDFKIVIKRTNERFTP